MQYNTHLSLLAIVVWRLQVLVAVSWLGLALVGQLPDSIGGWVSCPPAVYRVDADGRRRHRRGQGGKEPQGPGGWGWCYLCRTWRLPLWRSVALGAAWVARGQADCPWLIALPWVVWLSRVLAVWLPWLSWQPEWRLWQRLGGFAECWLLRVYLGLAVSGRLWGLAEWGARGEPWEAWSSGGSGGWSWNWSCFLCTASMVRVSHDESGRGYRAEISGNFTLEVAEDGPFRLRLLILFLRLLVVPDEVRGSRRTRDGRTPFVRQQALAEALGIPQPDISRWERYWLAGDWRRLLSQQAEEVLTLELQQRIIETWARLPSWGIERIHGFLVKQGVAVTESQVRQAGHESGWQVARGELARQCVEQGAELRRRDRWLVGELLRQIGFLLDKVERGQGLTVEERLEAAALREAGAEAGLAAPPPLKTLPWLLRVEQVVFGQWETVTDGSVRCLYCGSTQVARKSRQPREKKYYDEAGQLQTVAVYRYYCHNPQCPKGSFTDLPPGLVPYSRQRTEVHLLALQAYAWSYSNYRRTGAALGVASLTAYRWVSGWGQALLPVAALFGMVRSSGVVGVDEKYVLVPKNDKPAGKMRRWMYVYFAVDVYTYDLLHIAIFPHNNEESAQAFLLALRAKGYHPRVVVTDLRQDYGPVVAQVFPRAEHHECIFHALQNVQEYVKEAYGDNYAETHPEAAVLKERIYAIFDAKTKRTAHRRYAEVLALQGEYVQAHPAAFVIFDFLERHWPKLVNAIESDLVPTTNNTVELVIRRFDQHYQNFCGFQSIESAQLFLGVFEKLYRFTPFSPDAQPRLRGRSPLQLAGYDITQLPMTTLCNGQSIIWPTELAHVPNS